MRKMHWLVAAVAALFVSASAWANAPLEAIFGEIKSASADKNQFVLMEPSGKERLFTLVDGGKVHRDGRDSKLGDLKEGDHVVVLYVSINKGVFAVDVTHRNDKLGLAMKGTLQKTQGSNQFVLNSGGKDLLFTMVDNGIVKTDTKANDSLGNSKAGSEVVVHYIKQADGGLYAACVDSSKTRKE